MTRPAALLVTGSHRSGTTWAGQMLCASGEAAYIHEPMHPSLSTSWMRRRPDRLYPYIGGHDAGRYGDEFARILRFRYPLGARLREARSPATVVTALRLAGQARADARAGRMPLLKDPMALFAAPWLAATFGVRAVIVVRHPLGVVESALSRNWMVEPGHWLADAPLRTALVEPWVADIEAVLDRDAAERAAVAWKVMYGVALLMAQAHPDWVVVRYEDLVAEPAAAFADLYERLGLTYTDEARAIVASQSLPQGSRRTPAFDTDEVRRIRARVAGVAEQFYGDDTWAE